MESNCILIISEHPLFAEAITRVLETENITVTATAKNMNTALPLLKKHRPNIVIVDCDTNCKPDAQMISLLTGNGEARRVIFLTLADNQMTVHHWQHLGDATSADLISALRQGFPVANAPKDGKG